MLSTDFLTLLASQKILFCLIPITPEVIAPLILSDLDTHCSNENLVNDSR